MRLIALSIGFGLAAIFIAACILPAAVDFYVLVYHAIATGYRGVSCCQ